MTTVAHLLRAVLTLLLALVAVSLVVGAARPETGLVEKVVLLGLVAGCAYLATRIATFAAAATRRAHRH